MCLKRAQTRLPGRTTKNKLGHFRKSFSLASRLARRRLIRWRGEEGEARGDERRLRVCGPAASRCSCNKSSEPQDNQCAAASARQPHLPGNHLTAQYGGEDGAWRRLVIAASAVLRLSGGEHGRLAESLTGTCWRINGESLTPPPFPDPAPNSSAESAETSTGTFKCLL